MPGVLLDTYVIARLVNDPAKLSKRMREAIASNTGQIFASAASGMELARHVRDGNVTFRMPVGELLVLLEENGVSVLPVTWRDFAAAVSAPLPHKDPFDRILVATALGRGLALLTDDKFIRQCPGLTCIW
jgi:PIN domain nuclease of toxin-antitoxin system